MTKKSSLKQADCRQVMLGFPIGSKGLVARMAILPCFEFSAQHRRDNTHKQGSKIEKSDTLLRLCNTRHEKRG